MLNISPLSLIRNTDSEVDQRPTVSELRERLRGEAHELSSFAQDPRPSDGGELTFKAFEQALIPTFFALARTVVTLFLAYTEQREKNRIPNRLERAGRVRAPAAVVAKRSRVRWRNSVP